MRNGGYRNFSLKIFCLTVPKVFKDETFLCLRVLACAWHRLHLHALLKYAGENNLGKK